MSRIDGLARLFRLALGELALLVLVNHEPVRHHRLVGSASAIGHTQHERALKPSPMLVGGFEVEVCRALQFLMAVHHRHMAAAGINPDVQGVPALARALGQAQALHQLRFLELEPDVGSLTLHQIGYLADQLRVQEDFSPGREEDRQGHAPGALATDAPVRPRLHRATDPVPPPVGEPLGLVDLLQGDLPQPFQRNEKLLHRPENNGGLGAPAMRVVVLIILPSKEDSQTGQHRDDLLIAREHMPAHQLRHTDLLGELAVVVHRRDHLEAVLTARHIVVRAVTRGDVHHSRSRFSRDEGTQDDLAQTIQEGVLYFQSLDLSSLELDQLPGRREPGLRCKLLQQILGNHQVVALPRFIHEASGHVEKVPVQGHSHVGGKRPRSSGPDHQAVGTFPGRRSHLAKFRLRTIGEGKPHPDRRARLLLVFHLRLRQGGMRSVRPLHWFLALVDRPLLDQSGEDPDDLSLVARIESKVGILPVAKDTQSAKTFALDVDPLAREPFAATPDLGRFLIPRLLDDLELDGKSMAVPTGNKGHLATRHGARLHHQVLEHLVERRPHVDVTIRKGGAVVQDEPGRSLRPATGHNFPVKAVFLPLCKTPGLVLHEIAPHRKTRLR